MIRPARVADLPRLLELEQRCFAGDRLSRRSFRRLLTGGNAALLVAAERALVQGYALALFVAGRNHARLYSFAVDPDLRGSGIGRKLLAAAEAVVRRRGLGVMRLEVRADNRAAIGLYERSGYRRIARKPNYYEDGAPALCFEKPLIGTTPRPTRRNCLLQPAAITPRG